MKYFYLLVVLFSPIFLFGQVRGELSDQNPNHKKAYLAYKTKADSTSNLQSVTVQDTYKAVDEWQDKKDWREFKKKERFKARMYRYKYGRRYDDYRTYRRYPPYRYNYYNRGFHWSPFLLIP